MRVLEISNACWPLRNKAPNSDSAPDASRFLIILLGVYIGPLSGGEHC